jgi:hypothetical protein
MSKKKSRNKGNGNRPSLRRFSWPWLAAAAGVLLLIVGGVAVWATSNPKPAVTPQVAGAPKLVVDQKEVDEGYLQYDVQVRTAFRLSNVGDQPLEILGAPVKLVEGC